MSACWKVSWEEYLVMSSGINEPEYQLHCFNVEDGNVVFRTKREQKVLEDVISWANDGVIPERALSTGEPAKKVKKSKDTDGPSIGSIILENPNLLTNLRPKSGPWLQALCPVCADVGKDSDENHFYIHEESGGYGCVSDCDTAELTKKLASILKEAGIEADVDDTSQKEEEVETDEEGLAELLQEFPQYETVKEGDTVIGLRLKPVTERLDIDIPGSRIVKNTDHHIVEHVLLDGEYTYPDHTYCRIETSKTTGKEDKKYIDVPNTDVRLLWNAIVRHILPSPVIGGTFEVSDLWDTMKMDRTKQGEKYRRWNFPSDILILLGVIEKNGNTYTVRKVFK